MNLTLFNNLMQLPYVSFFTYGHIWHLLWLVNTQKLIDVSTCEVFQMSRLALSEAEKGNSAAVDETEKWRLTAGGMGLELEKSGFGALPAAAVAVSAAAERVNARQ